MREVKGVPGEPPYIVQMDVDGKILEFPRNEVSTKFLCKSCKGEKRGQKMLITWGPPSDKTAIGSKAKDTERSDGKNNCEVCGGFGQTKLDPLLLEQYSVDDVEEWIRSKQNVGSRRRGITPKKVQKIIDLFREHKINGKKLIWKEDGQVKFVDYTDLKALRSDMLDASEAKECRRCKGKGYTKMASVLKKGAMTPIWSERPRGDKEKQPCWRCCGPSAPKNQLPGTLNGGLGLRKETCVKIVAYLKQIKEAIDDAELIASQDSGDALARWEKQRSNLLPKPLLGSKETIDEEKETEDKKTLTSL